MTETARGAAPPEQMLVVGGGQVALLAAIALARALPGARVTLIDAPIQPDALADRMHVGLSGLAALHDRIGIEERLLLRHASASHCLAFDHIGWRGGGGFRIGLGAASRDAAGGFASRVPALAAALASRERFPDSGHPLSADLDPALRFDPAAYRDGLRVLAGKAGVQVARAPFAGAVRGEDGSVEGVALADGSLLRGDLIIDAAGPAALLRCAGSAAPPAMQCRATPIDRIATLDAPAAPRLSLSDSIRWEDGRYAIASPSRDGTRWWQGWSSAACSDEAALERLAALSGGIAQPAIPLRAGYMLAPWAGRVVAIGDAAGQFEPIGWLNLHLAAWQILLLLELLPGAAISPVERDEYNRRAQLLAANAHDYVAAHHGDAGQSAPLARRFDQFAHRGWLPAEEGDSVPPDLWAQLLIGQGAGPGPLPRLMALRPAVREAAEAETRRRVDAALAAAPPYARWLADFAARSANRG